MSVWAILAAAGSGERLGLDRPKAFAPLNDRPLVAEPLERLDASEWIEGIVIAAPPEWEEPCILVAEEVAAGKVAKAVTGGDDAQRVGARGSRRGAGRRDRRPRARRGPPAGHERGDRASDHCARATAGTERSRPCRSPTRSNGSTARRLRRRSTATGLVTAQTPQAFDANVLRGAFSTLQQTVTKSTDCASLVESSGGRVRAVEGDPRLLKVTTQADLELVESWL